MRRADHPTGTPSPGDGPGVTAVAPPAVRYGGVRSHPTGPAAGCLSQGDEHRRNTVGLTAKANSGLSSRPTTPEGSRPAVSARWSSSASINSGGCYRCVREHRAGFDAGPAEPGTKTPVAPGRGGHSVGELHP